MKRTTAVLLGLAILLQACEKPETISPELYTNGGQEITCGFEGGDIVLEFVSNMDCEAVIPMNAQAWISAAGATKADPTDRSLTLLIDENDSRNERSASVLVRTVDGSLSLRYTIRQEGGWHTSNDYSADGTREVLQTATRGSGINIVIMGDGYTDREIADGSYRRDMETACEYFFTEDVYAAHRDMFTVTMVNVVSATSGFGYNDTALGCSFGEGTAVSVDETACMEYAVNDASTTQEMLERLNDMLIIVVLNSHRYAGTCYMYYSFEGLEHDYGPGLSIALVPQGEDAATFRQIVAHEAAGHGFGKLADEYYYRDSGRATQDTVNEYRPAQANWWWVNVDFTDDPSEVRWSYFLSDPRYSAEGLGTYEGAVYCSTGAWRPTENSIMFYNTGGFNAPSREAIWRRIHKLAYGSEWEYDYEEFVAYDAANRQTAGSSAMVVAGSSALDGISGGSQGIVPVFREPLGSPVVKELRPDTLPGMVAAD